MVEKSNKIETFILGTTLKTTESPATRGCDKISQLRNLNKEGECLDGFSESPPMCGMTNPWAIDFGKMCLYLANCDKRESQQWVFRNKSYICNLQLDKCLAAQSEIIGSSEIQYRLGSMPFEEAFSSGEKWEIGERNRIVHSKTGMCMILANSTTRLFGIGEEETKFWAKLAKCSKEKGIFEEWVFESIINEGVHKCADYSSLQKSMNDENPEITSQIDRMLSIMKSVYGIRN